MTNSVVLALRLGNKPHFFVKQWRTDPLYVANDSIWKQRIELGVNWGSKKWNELGSVLDYLELVT